MLSNSSKYAIRAVLYLAIKTNESRKMGSKEVAEAINIPAPFLAKILQLLSKENVISSTKGPNGGFYLTKNDASNTILDIIDCTEGVEIFKKCFFGLQRCSDENPCAIHYLVAPFKADLLEKIGEKTIADFAKETKEGKSFIFLEE